MDTIYENILSNGSIIASPSKKPDYNFHWIRDSAIVIKSLIDTYYKNKAHSDNINEKCNTIFNNYINIELEHIKYHPAEPKFHIDGKPFLGEWGRPQNDGPALRGIVCIKLLEICPKRIEDLIKIINTDIIYTLDNIRNPCFDLWEEIYGFHFYTRLIQYKFLNIINSKNKNNLVPYRKLLKSVPKDKLTIAKKNVMDHFSIDTDKIFSSYTTNGNILREFDSSILMAFSFLDYELPDIDFKCGRISKYMNIMVLNFNNTFNINKKTNIPFLGRYFNDKYFDGNPWLISTIALFNYYHQCGILDNHKKEFNNFLNFLNKKKYILPEQIDKDNGSNVSVEKLTWNYAELLMFFNKQQNSIMDIIHLLL